MDKFSKVVTLLNDAIKQGANIVVILIKQHVVFGKFRARSPEIHVLICCVRENKTIESDVCVMKRWFYFFLQRFVKLNLGVLESLQVTNPFRIDECDVLMLPIVDPQDKVWIESTCFEEAYAFTTLVPEKVYFLTCKHSIPIVIKEISYI